MWVFKKLIFPLLELVPKKVSSMSVSVLHQITRAHHSTCHIVKAPHILLKNKAILFSSCWHQMNGSLLRTRAVSSIPMVAISSIPEALEE